MKNLINFNALWVFCICFCLPFLAYSKHEDEVKLEGPNVVNYNYPESFEEESRYIRQGKINSDGYCEFLSTYRAKPGEYISIAEIAYDPDTCRSLIIKGINHKGRERYEKLMKSYLYEKNHINENQ
ncbi:hypothetical protein [Photobacterium sp. TLY01]|uniref:hypothetical protein n=1 Tax=Photobacterium sp. TLY01 TaxID=2907534 RepID=UPI001F2361E1|nr:hypothetical protein [Photobacterium sp. TLY01]UIP29883.1 hypothetical protein LN341_20195 [Photobacterium sp. TLY01]